VEELKELMLDLSNKVNQKNTQLVKCLRNRERHRNRAAKHFDMVTAQSSKALWHGHSYHTGLVY